ncbi:uncharacterized protein EKO05_0000012 [Ascochyta rabiei]|uniref:uncharacterized protein n=1 Tax=Didymella rabiei TaxID=5454 RepID=UPI0021FB63C7|nr:uncharacterized protein EKO05_0000012 [Ascochyta rabiei]UPX09321.1 hypothetical protein EKO05_0000012 [Ascochyta rabiei]
MHSYTLILASLPFLVAAWDPKLCNNAGGCSTSTWLTQKPFTCPDGTRHDIPNMDRLLSDVTDGKYDIVSKANFPTECLNGAKPGANDILIKRATKTGQNAFLFISGTCTTKTPNSNCYAANDNAHKYSLCQVKDLSGGVCILNSKAGKCESYGSALPKCAGWTPAQVEVPCTFTGNANNCR